MRIGLTIDALSPRLTGIGRYALELCRGLREVEEVSDLAFYRFDDWIKRPEDFLVAPKKKKRRLPRTYRRWRSRPGFQNRLMHGTNYFLPALAEGGVVTVHDMSVFLHAVSHPADRVRAFERDFASTLDRADHIITDSETVRAEVIEYFALSPDRVSCVYLGASKAFFPRERSTIAGDLARLLGPGVTDYILCVATFEPRKRIEAAIRAHDLLCDRTGWSIPLVLVGASGWKNEALHALMEAGQAKGRLLVLGYIPESDLPAIYAGASLFLYPSIYEGFGLPPIEAMASGVPTIVSNQSCLPEITRNGALLIDPDDLEQFSLLIEQVLADEALRADRIAAGLEVAQGYSWAQCARDTLEIYRKIA